jgi:sigma-E factor negative regulatory protein RseB
MNRAAKLAARSDPKARDGVSLPRLWLDILCLVALLAAGLFSKAGATERSMEEQLARMATALRSLSYEGILVYAHESRLETMRIVRRVQDGRVHETLESLNGPERTVTREQDRVTCRLTGDSPISVHGRGLSVDLLGSEPIDPRALSPYYVFHPLGSARVAGRQTDVVGIIPRDAYRYGYRFYLDTETGLPLKTDLIGAEAKPIEQILFTSLNVDAQQSQGARSLEASPPGEGADSTPEEAGSWHFERLPAGFKLVMADSAPAAVGEGMEHFVLSDGLASISVYVEADAEDGLTGGSRIGAVHAAGGAIAGHQITVVGEVPADTVKAVLAGLVYGGGEAE